MEKGENNESVANRRKKKERKWNACYTPQAVQCKQTLVIRKSHGMVSTHEKLQNLRDRWN